MSESGRRVLVLNGPNLGAEVGFAVEVWQTDDEAELGALVARSRRHETPVVLNPAAFTHYSYALQDACAQRTAPLIEIHISIRQPGRSSGTPAWSPPSPAGRQPPRVAGIARPWDTASAGEPRAGDARPAGTTRFDRGSSYRR